MAVDAVLLKPGQEYLVTCDAIRATASGWFNLHPRAKPATKIQELLTDIGNQS